MIPTFEETMHPMLKFLSDGKERETSAIYKEMYRVFKVTSEERRRLQPSGQDLIVQNRIRWAALYMKKAGIIEAPRHGAVRITPRGLALLEGKPSKIDVDTLMRYREFQEFRTGTQAPHRTRRTGNLIQRDMNVKSIQSATPESRKSAGREATSGEHEYPSARIYSVEVNGGNNSLGFSAAHFISGHDPCGRLHGHNFCVRAHVEGKPDGSGMVVDFFALEHTIKDILADIDHKILVAKRHATVDPRKVRFMTTAGEVGVSKDAVALLDIDETTSELLADHILSKVMSDTNLDFAGLSSIAIGVGESDGRVGWSKRLLNP